MPDGILPTETTAPELAAETADSRMVQHVRRNLVLWSGGTTLVILLVLAAALYVAVAGSLASSATAQLDSRFDQVKSSLTGQRPNPPDDNGPYGFLFGGGGGGTIALAVDQDDNLLTPARVPRPGWPARTWPPSPRLERTVAMSGRHPLTGPGVRSGRIAVLHPDPGPHPDRERAGGRWRDVRRPDRRRPDRRTANARRDAGGPARSAAWSSCWSRSGSGPSMRDGRSCPIRESLANQRVALRRQREFAADASHELRTPLTVIRSSVEHLERHRDEPVATVGSALEDIDDEVRHMTAIVEDLLLLARSDSGAVALEHVPVDLGDVAADGASAMGKPATDRGVRVEVDPQPAVVAGDPARLRQLVMILVDNAIRHSPADGRVGVAVRANGSGASLVVEDDGPGIRPEDMPHVFERFYRAPGAPGGGTGLGLAIAKWIVDRHGGRIEVANRAEGGARFVVDLPATGVAPV